MNLFGAKSNKNEAIGIEFNADGVAIAHVRRPSTQQPILALSEFIPCDPGVNVADVLRNRLMKLGLQKCPVNIVMNAGNYQMLLGEAPRVPPAELAEALRWRVKELVQFPIADAVIDAFLLPEDTLRGSTRMAYAVVTQRNNVVQLIAQAKAAQLNLQAIDIPELSLLNLVQTCYDTKRGVAIVKIGQGGGSLQIIRDGSLYLSRQFLLAYDGGLLDDLPADNLILEMQRSLDYFERQMRQTPPSHVYVCGENITEKKLTNDIRNGLSVAIELLNIESGLQMGNSVQEHTLPLCLQAIGVALRQENQGGHHAAN